MRDEVVGESCVPGMQGLFEAVEGAMKFAHMSVSRQVDETKGLHPVNRLVRSHLEKHALHVELVGGPRFGFAEGGDGADHDRLQNGE